MWSPGLNRMKTERGACKHKVAGLQSFTKAAEVAVASQATPSGRQRIAHKAPVSTAAPFMEIERVLAVFQRSSGAIFVFCGIHDPGVNAVVGR